MNYESKTKWAGIDLDVIRGNYNKIKALMSPGSRLMAVVKADAYGHGAPAVAGELYAAGVDFFAVSNIDEAMQLRGCGIGADILILGATPEGEYAKLFDFDIISTVFSYAAAERLNSLGEKRGKPARVHIKTDTGMNRLGFKVTFPEYMSESAANIERIFRLPYIKAEGVFTHFADSCSPKEDFTRRQYGLFCELLDILKKRGIEPEHRHVCNSGAFIHYPDMHLSLVRCGIIMYGLYPEKNMMDIGIEPAMELRAAISQIRPVEPNESVSYGRTYKPGRKILAATLPIGYADGFSRLFSNSGSVIIRGKKVPVIGRVCMDQTIVDVTGTGAAEGDDAVIFGRCMDERISVEELADLIETINYEVVCLIGKRVPRIYSRNGKYAGELNYIKNSEL